MHDFDYVMHNLKADRLAKMPAELKWIIKRKIRKLKIGRNGQ